MVNMTKKGTRKEDPAMVVVALRHVWTDLTREFKEYREDQRMLWHEDDLCLHLGHRLIVQLSKSGEFDVHANVKIDPKLYEGRLNKALEEALPRIQRVRKKDESNYVDLVVNRRQNVSDPFLLCAELKYWYYDEHPNRILKKLKEDLKRLAIIKEEGVAEEVACLILNAHYKPDADLIRKSEVIIENYEQKRGLIKSVCHTHS